MRLASRGVFEMEVSASISYIPSTGAVNVLLQGCDSDQQKRIASQVRRLSILTRHPLLLPLLLIEEKLNLIEDQEMQWWNALVNVRL